MKDSPIPLQVLIKRVHWFILMRWLFIALYLLVVLALKQLLPAINVGPFFLIAVLLIVLNSIYIIVEKRNGKRVVSARGVYIFSSIQLAFDYIILSFLLYISGTVTNPFTYAFNFHIIISCLLLPTWLAGLLTFGSVAFFLALSFASQLQFIPYYPFPLAHVMERPCMIGFSVSTASFLFIIAAVFYFAMVVTSWLRRREEELHELSQAKLNTMMHLAHDLKSPIAATQSSIKSIIDGYADPVNDKVHDMLNVVYRRTRNATAMITEMFDLIKLDEYIKAGSLQKQSFSLNKLINGIVESFGTEFNGKTIQWNIEVADNTNVFAEGRQIEMLITNLVSNAIRYSNSPVKIRIFAKILDKSLYIRIGDNGIGIPREERKKVFNDFYRTTEAKKFHKDGIGLGLAIVKKVVDFHNGTINIEDGEGGVGATFIVKLPQNQR